MISQATLREVVYEYMMDIAYITAAAFDILADFHRICFSGGAHELKKGFRVGGCVHTETTMFKRTQHISPNVF